MRLLRVSSCEFVDRSLRAEEWIHETTRNNTKRTFRRTVDWAVEAGITTATFHILTPYPGTALFSEMESRQRIETRNWDLYDTRHVVYRPSCMSPAELKRGYDWAYEEFYRWSNIFEAAASHNSLKHQLKHFFYSAGWKKFERAWDLVIRLKQLAQLRPVLEAVLSPVNKSVRDQNKGSTREDIDLICAVGKGQAVI